MHLVLPVVVHAIVSDVLGQGSNPVIASLAESDIGFGL